MILETDRRETHSRNVDAFQKPELADSFRMRIRWSRFVRNTRAGDGGGKGGLPQGHDANIDLNHLPEDVREQVKQQMGTIHEGGQGSVRVFTVTGKDGKTRTIIDL